MANRVCETLGIEYPVIQGAMAWTSMGPLVAAVSEAGGLGVLGSGFMPKEIILEQVNMVRQHTKKPFAANLFLDPGTQLEIGVSAIIEGKVPVAYIDSLNLLNLDMTTEYYKKLHDAGCKIIAKINEDRRASMVEDFGIDSIVSAKTATADAILSYIRARKNSQGSANVETLYQLVDDKVEALEFIIKSETRYTGIPFKDLAIKSNNLIACIARKRQIIIPGGDDCIEVGDSVIVITMEKHIEDIEDILA